MSVSGTKFSPRSWVTAPTSNVCEAPGSRVTRASPLRKAFGGQVIGSTASPRRSTAGVAREHHEVRIALVDPERRLRRPSDASTVDAGETVVVALEVGEAVVEFRAADRPRQRKSSSVPSTATVPTGMPRSSERSAVRAGTRRSNVVDRPRSEREVRMRSTPVRTGRGADVRRRRPDREAARRRARTRCGARARTGSPAAGGGDAPSTTRCGARSRACHDAQRTRPWIAFECSGSSAEADARARRTRSFRPQGGWATG